jgi:hypothetical protein
MDRTGVPAVAGGDHLLVDTVGTRGWSHPGLAHSVAAVAQRLSPCNAGTHPPIVSGAPEVLRELVAYHRTTAPASIEAFINNRAVPADSTSMSWHLACFTAHYYLLHSSLHASRVRLIV